MFCNLLLIIVQYIPLCRLCKVFCAIAYWLYTCLFAILLIYMAQLTPDDVLKLARLSKLELTADQLERFRLELQEIVAYVDQLRDVNVEGLEPTNQVTGLHNATRPDEPREYASPEELLKNLPSREGDQIKVNQMIG